MSRSFAKWTKALRAVLASESLPEIAEPPKNRPCSFLTLLFRSEPLPLAPTSESPSGRARASPRLLSTLLAPEDLPFAEAPAPHSPRRSFLRALLSSEALPSAEGSARPARRTWFRWLFAPESIDSSATEAP